MSEEGAAFCFLICCNRKTCSEASITFSGIKDDAELTRWSQTGEGMDIRLQNRCQKEMFLKTEMQERLFILKYDNNQFLL